ncbi:hypothetical protein BIV02_06830 [Curtobacterium sp. MMLR14_014]|uniref:hypothetical protein n=1 Tax=unclassified Curtobacterium TaxID=257496 RepID=UPI0008F91337|nr:MULTISPECIES: hypothetical protein [unclassified Curtobacterium]OII40417.1 hypothetical protein BIU91_00855 [Curtobacterium sp. MMLR14_002]OII41770.1 hypothetical protein BIV02_06830 [Curtobacterium sp. MMLR14_014]
MLTTANTTRRRLLLQATAVLALLLLVGFTVLMHSMLGHATTGEHAMTAMTAEHTHSDAAGHGADAAAPAGAVVSVLSDAGCDGGLCALMCSLMGMACALTIALFAWALLRTRNGGVLYVLARLLALGDRVARRVAAPKPPSLTALQIIRI